MNEELDALEDILNYLETTSLEPHDNYTSEFTYKEQKILYKYITKLVNDKTKLQNNWNELKKWLEEKMSVYEHQEASNFYVVFEKMQGLEGNNE